MNTISSIPLEMIVGEPYLMRNGDVAWILGCSASTFHGITHQNPVLNIHGMILGYSTQTLTWTPTGSHIDGKKNYDLVQKVDWDTIDC